MGQLTEKDQKELVRLMEKITFPAPLVVFESWCRVFGVVCAELAVFRDIGNGPEIFLTYREDKFFKGWHIPGCVHIPTEEFKATLARVLEKEIHANTDEPVFFDWFERPYGEQDGYSARGHEFSFVYIANLIGEIVENDNEKFFPLKKIPLDTMHHQTPIFNKILEKFNLHEFKK